MENHEDIPIESNIMNESEVLGHNALSDRDEEGDSHDEVDEDDSEPEPESSEVEHIKQKILNYGFVPIIDLAEYERGIDEIYKKYDYNTFHAEGLLSPRLSGSTKRDPLPFACDESLFSPFPSTNTSDLEADIANIMKFLDEDTEDTKKRLEYEKKARGIDWDNLEYQNSQTDYLADDLSPEGSHNDDVDHNTQDPITD